MSLIITAHIPELPISIGENLTLTIHIKNNTNTFVAPQRLESKSNSLFVGSSCNIPAIPVDHVTIVQITLECSGAKFVSDVTSSVELRLTGPHKYEGTSWCLPMYCFIGRLYKFKPPTFYTNAVPDVERCNIYLFGIAGATKSSFINSVLTLMNRQYNIITRAVAGGGNRHTTTSLVKFQILETVALFDTWGLTPETYTSQDMLDALFIGKLPQGFSIDAEYNSYRNEFEYNKDTWAKRKAHCCLFFIPHGSLENEDEVDLIKNTFARIQKKHGLNPILLISKVDELIAEVRSNPLGNYPQLTAAKQKLAILLNIPLRNIFYCINYTTEDTRSFEIDRNTFKILERVLEHAYENVQHNFGSTSNNENTNQIIKNRFNYND